jgi:class 3 adenylate cyclase/YHS domain-containing protein
MKKTVGILMADLSGYTAMTEIHGDNAAVEVVEKYIGMGQSSLAGKSYLLERTGDQLLIVGEDADDLAKTATELKYKTEKEPNFLGIHCGLHFGSVIERNHHLFGAVVNMAARITGIATENKIFCSVEFVEALKCPEKIQLISQGNINFKNVLESAEIFEVLPAIEKKKREIYIDPVCHIRLSADEIHISLLDGEDEYFFCSEECKKIFQEHNIGVMT